MPSQTMSTVSTPLHSPAYSDMTTATNNVPIKRSEQEQYYASSLTSLAPEPTGNNAKATEEKAKTGLFASLTGWLWNALGWNNASTSAILNKTDPLSVDSISAIELPVRPVLPPPPLMDSKAYKKAADTVQRDLVEKLSKSADNDDKHPYSFDNVLIKQILAAIAKQTKLKEDEGVLSVIQVQQSSAKTKDLWSQIHKLKDGILERKRTNEILGWVSAGATVSFLGAAALAYFTMGSTVVLAVVSSVATMTKGVSTVLSGYTKHKMDVDIGNLTFTQQQIKTENREKETLLNEFRTLNGVFEELNQMNKQILDTNRDGGWYDPSKH